MAASCTDVFPDGASSTTDTSTMTFHWNAKILNSPDGVLETKSLTDYSAAGSSCSYASCSASNQTSTSAAPPVSFTGGPPRNYNGGTATLSPGNYGSVTLNNQAQLYLQDGTYIFNGNFIAYYRSKIRIAPGANVKVYVQGNIEFHEVEVNQPDQGQLLLYATANVFFYYAARVNAIVYAEGNVELHDSVQLTGALSAGGNMFMYSGSTINYSAEAFDGGFGSFCETGGGGAEVVDDISLDLGSASASTCAPKSVTISILNASGDVFTGFVGQLTLSSSTGHGTWSKTGTANHAYGTLTGGGDDSGAATYQFAADGADQGVITLQMTNTHAETLTVNAESEGVTEQSSAVTFAENALVVSASDSLGSDQVVGRSHQYQVQMLKRDPVSGACGVAANYSQGQVKAWIVRTSRDPAGDAPRLINNNSTHNIVLPSAEPGTANFNISFNNGIASVRLLASDAGHYALQLADVSSSFSDVNILGGSDTITARPFGFDIQVTDNPKASDSDGAVFRAAGDAFEVRVRAVRWQSEDDQNNDGIPDGHDDNDATNNANLSNNSSVLSFGKENAAEAVQLSAQLLQPSGGLNAALVSLASLPSDGTTVTAFASGQGSTSQVTYPEVGVVELGATILDSVYITAGSAASAKIVGRSGNVGRFTPKYFLPVELATPITPFCDSALAFSYLGQAFHVHIGAQAKNTQGGTTTNYRDSFVKLDQDSHIEFGANDGGAINLTSRVSANAVEFDANSGLVQINAPVTIARAVAPDGPFVNTDIGILITDADGIGWRDADLNLDVDADSSADYVDIATTYLKFGRLFLADAYGPETANLPVTMQVQAWDSVDWARNRDDSCTQIPLTDIAYPEGSIDVAANRAVNVGGGTSRGEYGSISGPAVGFLEGDAQHYFSAPGQGNTGNFFVNVDMSNLAWLRFDWNQDGDYSDPTLPSAEYHFGIYRGHDSLLYWREISR